MLNILYGEDKLNKKTLPEKIKFHKNNLSKKPKLNKKNLRKKRKFNKKRCRFQLLVSFYSKKQHTKHKLKSFVNYLRRFCKKEKKQIKTLIPPSLVKHKISLIETLSYERRLLFFIIFKQRKKYFFKRKEKISILSVLKKSFTPKLLRVKIVKLKKLLKTGKCIYNFHRFNCLKASGPSKKIKSFPFLKLNKILCVFLQRFVGIEQIKIRFFSTQLKFLPTFKLLRRKVDRRLFFFKRNKSLTPYFKESLEILFLVFSMFSFGNAILLTKLIGRLLEVNRRQIVIVKFFKKVMAIFFRRLPKRVCGLSGMRIMIIGRFNKRPRTKTIILQQGQICLQTISIPIDFHYRQVVTLFGSFGVKVWLSKKIEKEKKMKLYNGGKKRK
jgi:hypothetical protein